MLKRAVALALAAAAPIGLMLAVPTAPAPAAAAQDWTKTVVATPEGGFRLGNPNAAVKVVEYGSMTCPHCASFAGEAMPPLLAKYIKSGKVSFEFRNFVLNGIDVTASLLARCAAPKDFFGVTDRFFATQQQWVGKIASMTQAEKDALQKLPAQERLWRIATQSGLVHLAAANGVAPPKGRQCLADEAGFKRLGDIHEAASTRYGIRGTPSFLINGAAVEAHGWSELEPLIRSAGG